MKTKKDITKILHTPIGSLNDQATLGGPVISGERIETRFMLSPKTIGGDKRWLRVSRIRQEHYVPSIWARLYGDEQSGWYDKSWEDNQPISLLDKIKTTISTVTK